MKASVTNLIKTQYITTSFHVQIHISNLEIIQIKIEFKLW